MTANEPGVPCPPSLTKARVASGTQPRVSQSALSHSQTGWRAAPSVIQVLRTCGWLQPADIDDPQLRVQTTASSHSLHRVTAPDGRSVVVKHVPQSAAAQGRGLRTELFVYRLAAWLPEIARAVPTPVYMDEGRQVLVIEAVGDDLPWSEPFLQPGTDWPDVCAQLGRLLAGVHTATRDMALPPSPAPGILGLTESLEEACRSRHQSTQALMHLITEDAPLAAALRAGAAAYQQLCVIHGDLRQANWRIDDRSAERHLKVFDWELAGSGDPAFDLACVLGELVLQQIHERAAQSGCGQLEPWVCPPSVLLNAYFADSRLLGDSLETRHKLLLFVVARLLHVACECSEQGVDVQQWPVSAILTTARQFASERARVDTSLWGRAQ